MPGLALNRIVYVIIGTGTLKRPRTLYGGWGRQLKLVQGKRNRSIKQIWGL